MRYPRNFWEDPPDDDPPSCDLKWSKDCDNRGVYYLLPERACCACFSACSICHEQDWIIQQGDERLCGDCLTAQLPEVMPQSEAERHALVLAQMEGRR